MIDTFNKFIKNLATINNTTNTIAEEYEPEAKVWVENKKIVISILNKIRNNLPDY